MVCTYFRPLFYFDLNDCWTMVKWNQKRSYIIIVCLCCAWCLFCSRGVLLCIILSGSSCLYKNCQMSVEANTSSGPGRIRVSQSKKLKQLQDLPVSTCKKTIQCDLCNVCVHAHCEGVNKDIHSSLNLVCA